MELLELADDCAHSFWMPSAGCSKRKQAHTVIADCSREDEQLLLLSPPVKEEEHPELHLLDSLDSLLASRQNSGVFLKDPNVCLMDWESAACGAAGVTVEAEEHKHPALNDLYGSFESAATDPTGPAPAGVSIIPLTPEQVSRLTGSSQTPLQQSQASLAVSPVSIATETTASASRQQHRGRRRANRRSRVDSGDGAVVDPDDESDADGCDGAGASPDYRRRRERNNVAVRKSRAKTRAREQVVDQTLGRLRHCNEDLRKRVDSVVRELKFLKSLMQKTRIQLPAELSNALRTYPMYFEPAD